jgi:hypothetical protein
MNEEGPTSERDEEKQERTDAEDEEKKERTNGEDEGHRTRLGLNMFRGVGGRGTNDGTHQSRCKVRCGLVCSGGLVPASRPLGGIDERADQGRSGV